MSNLRTGPLIIYYIAFSSSHLLEFPPTFTMTLFFHTHSAVQQYLYSISSSAALT